MRTLVLRGEVVPDELVGVLADVGVETQGSAAYAFGHTRILLILGRKHFLRANSYLGLALLASTDGTTQRIDVGHAGAGSGVLGIDWGAGEDLETSVYNLLLELVQQKGWTVQS